MSFQAAAAAEVTVFATDLVVKLNSTKKDSSKQQHNPLSQQFLHKNVV